MWKDWLFEKIIEKINKLDERNRGDGEEVQKGKEIIEVQCYCRLGIFL